ncbi:sensor domain-containing diguanylate cyclase [Nocardioides sp.]|uniref:GGDEF domain-containing protein n=1 Tax=Nocardioides sp. TaxID=35761 RepID=UPI002609DF15|nr:sensor domain-containing diguanylate cyclase [Nocardioides sp.]
MTKHLPPQHRGVTWLPTELHPREEERIAAVRALHIVGASPEPELDRIAEVAASLCGVPYGSVNIIDAEQHYTAASFGAPRVNASRADSLCALAILGGSVLRSENATEDPRFAHKAFLGQVDPPIRLFAAAPILTSDRLPIGTLRVYGEQVAALSQGQVAGLERLAELTMSVLDMRAAAVNLGGLAVQDALTGLPNRRAFDTVATRHRSGEATYASLAFLDLNGFKAVNDTFGHQVGDAVLAQTARRIEAVAGHGDLVLRIGGDEFVALFAERTDVDQIEADLRDAVSVPTELDGRLHQIRAAIGAVSIADGEDLEEALQRGDELMYLHKKRPGRG